jgi:hypothetical protein
VVSAVPSDLFGYAKIAVGHSATIIGLGNAVQAAIGALNASHPDPSILGPVPDLGAQLKQLGIELNTNGEWVAKIAEAFLIAGDGIGTQVVQVSQETLDWCVAEAGQFSVWLGYGTAPLGVAAVIPGAGAFMRLFNAWRSGQALPETIADLTQEARQQIFERWVETGDDSIWNELGPMIAGRVDAANAFTKQGIDQALELAGRGGLPDSGFWGAAAKVTGWLGIAGDALTIINPGVGGTEGAIDRGMAGANLVATAAVLAEVNFGLDWIPVAGEVVMLATGLYLAADWAYQTFKPFHDFVDDVGHDVDHGFHTVAHAVSHFFSSIF